MMFLGMICSIQSLSIFNQPGKGSKSVHCTNLRKGEKICRASCLVELSKLTYFQCDSTYFVSQYGHDQVFPSFITWYTNWVMDAELEMNLEHPDHILEEVNKEELDMPTNMEGDEEETFKRMNG
ncbi:hypothetical protein H5410_061432 [Solanum commersonii]|uniref:Uncharacterized protein n=1 Tax=Solanum commersonii TaxID=4109 RepID=A0A9J5W7Z2_SOLCO|nr:hypothetical protein H5410_061432 [Solanum commersonii]